MMNKIRVIIADDHPAFREGLERLLQEEEDIEVVGQAGDGEAAIMVSTELQPDVAILDIAMPKLNGLEAAKQIKAASPNTSILILSTYDNEQYVLSAIDVGVEGYLLKSVGVRELAGAIRALHGGETVLDTGVARKIFQQLSSAGDKERTSKASNELNPREVEVLKLISGGMANKEIAQKLVISVRTVETHLANIYLKLKVNSRTEAVLEAVRRGVISLDE